MWNAPNLSMIMITIKSLRNNTLYKNSFHVIKKNYNPDFD